MTLLIKNIRQWTIDSSFSFAPDFGLREAIHYRHY